MVSLIIFQIFDGFSNVLIDFQAVASSYLHFAKSVSLIFRFWDTFFRCSHLFCYRFRVQIPFVVLVPFPDSGFIHRFGFAFRFKSVFTL